MCFSTSQYSTRHVNWKSVLKMTFFYLVNFCVPKSANSLCWLHHPRYIEPHLWTECYAECIAIIAAIHTIVHSWRELSVRGAVLFGGDSDGNKPSCYRILHTCGSPAPVILQILHILVLGLHWAVAWVSSSPRCRSHSAFAHCSPPKFSVPSHIFSDVKFYWYSTTATLPFPLQKSCTKCMLTYSSFWLQLHCNTAQSH